MALVTDAGLTSVMTAWSAYASRPQYLQFGTGSGQTDTSTDLATPVQSRILGTTTQTTVNVSGDTFRITGQITASADTTVSELGVFDAVTGGNMDVYGDFTGIPLENGDAIVFQVNVTAV